MKGQKLFFGRMIALFICLVLFVIPATAQEALTYGGGASGTLSATAPLSFYTFSGNADDVVSIQVLAITSGLQPVISLNSPTQQQLAFNSGDPFNAGTARITYQLPQTGLYTILVSGNGTTGDFAIRLDGSAPPPSTDVSGDEDVQSTLDTDNPSQVYSIQASPDAPTIVTISTDTSAFEFTALVRNSAGQTIATFIGNDSQDILVTLPQGNGTFNVEVRPLVVGTQGDIQVSIELVGAPDVAETPTPTLDATVPPPVATEEVENTNACTVINNSVNAINIRGGAGTNFEIVGSFAPNTSRTVIGVNSATGWYQIVLLNGGVGWVFGDLVTFDGDCSQLPEVEADSQEVPPTQVPPTNAPTQAQQATPTFTPSYTPTVAPTGQQQQATATFTPSYTPTLQATATFTPSYTPTTPPPQLAPPDARFNNPLNIALDSTASVLDFVSYPDGDTEDRVRWDITGMNSNSSLPGGRARLVISVSCFGNNTDQVQFFTGGQTYACGSTIVDQEVTFNSKTGSVVITAVGGEGTYVQWVLTGTATRVNN